MFSGDFFQYGNPFFFINENLESPSSYLQTLISPSKRGEKQTANTYTDEKASRSASDATVTPLSSPASTALYNGSFFHCLVSVIFPPPLLFFSAFQQCKQSGTINNTQGNRTVRSIRLSLSGEGSNVGLMWCLCYRSRFGATVDIFQPFGFLTATFWKFFGTAKF